MHFFEKKVENPQLWSAEIPYLYDLEIEVSDENGTVIFRR